MDARTRRLCLLSRVPSVKLEVESVFTEKIARVMDGWVEGWKQGGVEDCYSSSLFKNKPVRPAGRSRAGAARLSAGC